MSRFLVFALALLTLVTAAAAQDDVPAPVPPPVDPVVEFLAGLSGLDESICGTYEFQIRFRSAPIGSATLNVAPAEEGSGAVYIVRFDAAMTAGQDGFEGKETILLDEKLAIISGDVWKRETRAGTSVEKSSRLRRVDGAWVFTNKAGSEESTSRHEYAGLLHGGTAAELLMVMKLAGREPATYLFKGIDWPEGADDPDHQPVLKDLVITVEAGDDIHISGEALPGRDVRIHRVDGKRTTYRASNTGTVGTFGPAGSPVVFVSDKYTPPPPPKADGPADAVVVYLKVLAGSLPVDALDGVMDWAALMEWLKPGATGTAVAFGAELKQVYASKVGAISDAQVEAITPLLTVTEEDGLATVTMPGQEDNPFKLAKRESGWFIVRFPK